MSPLRLTALTGLSAVSTWVFVQVVGCGTKAVGINDCRDIEEARCEAAAHCGEQIPVEDVDTCKRFYRDQCLHGLATQEDPSSNDVRACVAAIRAAGECADALGPDAPIGDCNSSTELGQGFDGSAIETVCDAVALPQHTNACFFLNGSDEEPPTSSQGGSSGSGTNPFVGASGAASNSGAAGTESGVGGETTVGGSGA